MKKIFVVLFIFSFSAYAQQPKEEREEDIERSEMPEAVQTYLTQNLPSEARKVRDYFETDGSKKSYETKFKYRGRKYSVEFSEEGELEEIEAKAKPGELAKVIINNIRSYLENENDRYKIEKLEAQYRPGKEDAMQRALNIFKSEPDYFEVIVATRNDDKFQKYEITFDSQGNFVKQRKVIRISYDYLIF